MLNPKTRSPNFDSATEQFATNRIGREFQNTIFKTNRHLNSLYPDLDAAPCINVYTAITNVAIQETIGLE